jgi:hypothetical protein
MMYRDDGSTRTDCYPHPEGFFNPFALWPIHPLPEPPPYRERFIASPARVSRDCGLLLWTTRPRFGDRRSVAAGRQVPPAVALHRRVSVECAGVRNFRAEV